MVESICPFNATILDVFVFFPAFKFNTNIAAIDKY